MRGLGDTEARERGRIHRAVRSTQTWTLLGLVLISLGSSGCRKSGATPGPKPASTAAGDPFRDVAREAGISFRQQPAVRPMRILESVGSGCAFSDFDTDGHLDLFLAGTPTCALFRSNGDGTFEDVTARSGLGGKGTWTGCAVADVNGDGLPDLLVAGYNQSRLFLNRGGMVFEDGTSRSKIRMEDRWATSAAFADFDRDGIVDLYVGSYVEFGPHTKQYCVLHQSGIQTSCRPVDYEGEYGRCYRGKGDGTFTDVTAAWGLDKAQGKCLGVAVADYDRDGWTDLYVANDELTQELFLNQKGKGFKNVALETGTAYGGDGRVPGGMGVDWGDINNDGWMDLALGTFQDEAKNVWLNREGASFDYVSPALQVLVPTLPSVVFGTLLFDHDNDGWNDLLFANGHVMDNITQMQPTSSFRQPTQLFRNEGGKRFAPVRSPSMDLPIAGRGVASGDYDNDGDLDLVLTDLDGEARLLQNQAPRDRHWLIVALKGPKGNREGYGARITLRVDGKERVDEVRGGRSYLSVCDPRVHFGLGSATVVESVEVRWPSGKVSRQEKVAADQVLVLEEGK